MPSKSLTKYQKLAWESYFEKRSFLIRLLKWTQKKFLVPKFAQAIKLYIKPADKVLEAGCGTAMNTLYICSFVGAQPYGLDISEYALREAIKWSIYSSRVFRSVVGDIKNIPFHDRCFDIVWNQGVLEHFENPTKVITEMARVGNIVFIAVPRRTLYRGLVQKAKAFFGLTPNDRFYLYSESELVSLMSRTNLLDMKASGSFNVLLMFSWTWACGFSIQGSGK